jgi:hypothetical protein
VLDCLTQRNGYRLGVPPPKRRWLVVKERGTRPKKKNENFFCPLYVMFLRREPGTNQKNHKVRRGVQSGLSNFGKSRVASQIANLRSLDLRFLPTSRWPSQIKRPDL